MTDNHSNTTRNLLSYFVVDEKKKIRYEKSDLKGISM